MQFEGLDKAFEKTFIKNNMIIRTIILLLTQPAITCSKLTI